MFCWKMMHVTEYIAIFYKGICVKCRSLLAKKARKVCCRRNFFVFLDRKFASLMIHPSIQIAYKYHYPSSTNANYSRQALSRHFYFSIFTCFSHVNLNFVPQDISIQMCVNIITCEKLFTATESGFVCGGKKMWKEKEIPSHNRQRKKKKMNRELFRLHLEITFSFSWRSLSRRKT